METRAGETGFFCPGSSALQERFFLIGLRIARTSFGKAVEYVRREKGVRRVAGGLLEAGDLCLAFGKRNCVRGVDGSNPGWVEG